MTSPGAKVLAELLPVWRERLPPSISRAYFDGFVRRNRPRLEAQLDALLADVPEIRVPREHQGEAAINELARMVDALGRGAFAFVVLAEGHGYRVVSIRTRDDDGRLAEGTELARTTVRIGKAIDAPDFDALRGLGLSVGEQRRYKAAVLHAVGHRADPRVLDDFVKIAADDVSSLRRIDAERVLDAARGAGVGDVIAREMKLRRPDLRGEVDEWIAEQA